jgi:hypothetical protein
VSLAMFRGEKRFPPTCLSLEVHLTFLSVYQTDSSAVELYQCQAGQGFESLKCCY